MAYVVVCGEPGARLVDLVVAPHDVLRNPHKLRVNAKYYITKQVIPALGRVFNLVGVSLVKWFADMRKPQVRRFRAALGKDSLLAAASGKGAVGGGGRKIGGGGNLAVTTIDQFYMTDRCELCGKLCKRLVCSDCHSDAAALGLVLTRRAGVAEKQLMVGVERTPWHVAVSPHAVGGGGWQAGWDVCLWSVNVHVWIVEGAGVFAGFARSLIRLLLR